MIVLTRYVHIATCAYQLSLRITPMLPQEEIVIAWNLTDVKQVTHCVLKPIERAQDSSQQHASGSMACNIQRPHIPHCCKASLYAAVILENCNR